MAMGVEEFEVVVEHALAQIPEGFLRLIENCVVVIEDRPADPADRTLAFYEGIPLSERTSQYSAVLPDRIVIYRLPILARCSSAEQVTEQVRITVWHEVAHFFGIDDASLEAWGYG